MTKRTLTLRGDPAEIFRVLRDDPDNRNSRMHTVGEIVVSLLMTGEEPTFRDRLRLEMVGIAIEGTTVNVEEP